MNTLLYFDRRAQPQSYGAVPSLLHRHEGELQHSALWSNFLGRGPGLRQEIPRFMRNDERFQRLKSLTPAEAARAWLNGEFGVDDEPAMIEAIRKDKRIKLSDDEIIDFFSEALTEDDWDAQRCLDELVNRS